MVKVSSITIFLFLIAATFAQQFGDRFNDQVVVGDMILTRRQHKWLYGNGTIKRNGLSNKAFRWPGGIVPVVISPQFDQASQNKIRAAAAHIQQGSCIKFLFDFDARSHPVHLSVLPADPQTCMAQVGYLGSSSTMNIGIRCSQGNTIHEFLHILGFYHMHTAAVRDNFVSINFKNIQPSLLHNFEKVTKDVSMFNTEYDFSSIMHYPPNAFAINPNIPTLMPRGTRNVEPDMGRKTAMSSGDFKRLNRMYECRR